MCRQNGSDSNQRSSMLVGTEDCQRNLAMTIASGALHLNAKSDVLERGVPHTVSFGSIVKRIAGLEVALRDGRLKAVEHAHSKTL
jgi:hypothetical protein